MKHYSIIFILLLLCHLNAFAQDTYTFAQRDTIELKMDVYRPAHPRADSACVVYVFGGGFVTGSRQGREAKICCQKIADQGFVAIAIDYRLWLKYIDGSKVGLFSMGKVFLKTFEIAAADCSAALRYIYDHADQLRVARKRIILTGSSAGAVTVLQTDFCRANGMAPAAELPADFKPAAVIAYSGGVGCRTGKLKYATPPAPTCLFHGTIDRVVPYSKISVPGRLSIYGAKQLAKVFDKNNYCYHIYRFADRGHEVAMYLMQSTDAEYFGFIDAALAGRTFHYDTLCVDDGLQPNAWTHMTVMKLYTGKLPQ